MKDFWKKADKYVKDNLDKVDKPENFIYGNSEIEPEILLELIKLKESFDYYSEAYDREYDYARLLRMENSDLKDYIEELEDLLDSKNSSNNLCIDISGNNTLLS